VGFGGGGLGSLHGPLCLRHCGGCGTYGRCVSVPVAALRAAARHRLLPDPSLRADDADRDPVLGVVLDQHRRQSGAGLARPADSADDDDDERCCTRVATPGLLYQSHRRLDDHVPRLCVRLAHRVCRRQRRRPPPGADGRN